MRKVANMVITGRKCSFPDKRKAVPHREGTAFSYVRF